MSNNNNKRKTYDLTKVKVEVTEEDDVIDLTGSDSDEDDKKPRAKKQKMTANTVTPDRVKSENVETVRVKPEKPSPADLEAEQFLKKLERLEELKGFKEAAEFSKNRMTKAKIKQLLTERTVECFQRCEYHLIKIRISHIISSYH